MEICLLVPNVAPVVPMPAVVLFVHPVVPAAR